TNWCIKNMAWTLAIVGTINPHREFRPPISPTTRYCGTIVNWYGIMSIAMIIQKTVFRPRNLIFANAYAPIDAKRCPRTTDAEAYIPEFIAQRPMYVLLSASA